MPEAVQSPGLGMEQPLGAHSTAIAAFSLRGNGPNDASQPTDWEMLVNSIWVQSNMRTIVYVFNCINCIFNCIKIVILNGKKSLCKSCRPMVSKLVGCDPPVRELLVLIPLRDGEEERQQYDPQDCAGAVGVGGFQLTSVSASLL